MGERLFRGESAVEYFKELVEAAVERQRLEADELTSFYVVNLLAGCVRLQSGATGWAANEPLGLEFRAGRLHGLGQHRHVVVRVPMTREQRVDARNQRIGLDHGLAPRS